MPARPLFMVQLCDAVPITTIGARFGLIHVTGSAIVPSSFYDVENLPASCIGVEEDCTAVSAPLLVRTARWGDVESPYNPPSLTTQPDVGDIAAMVSKFRSSPDGPVKARILLAGTDAFGSVNMSPDLDFTHIAACVDAFRGLPYPYKMGKCSGPPVPGISSICDSDWYCRQFNLGSACQVVAD